MFSNQGFVGQKKERKQLFYKKKVLDVCESKKKVTKSIELA